MIDRLVDEASALPHGPSLSLPTASSKEGVEMKELALRLRYAVRATWHDKSRSPIARVRKLWHDFIVHALLNRGGERCQDCGRGYYGLMWWSPAPLWMELVGHYGGLLCPTCFGRRADAADILVMWTPMVVRRDGVATTNHWFDPVRDRLLMGEPDPDYFAGGKVNAPQGHWGEIGALLGWSLPSEYPDENRRAREVANNGDRSKRKAQAWLKPSM